MSKAKDKSNAAAADDQRREEINVFRSSQIQRALETRKELLAAQQQNANSEDNEDDDDHKGDTDGDMFRPCRSSSIRVLVPEFFKKHSDPHLSDSNCSTTKPQADVHALASSDPGPRPSPDFTDGGGGSPSGAPTNTADNLFRRRGLQTLRQGPMFKSTPVLDISPKLPLYQNDPKWNHRKSAPPQVLFPKICDRSRNMLTTAVGSTSAASTAGDSERDAENTSRAPKKEKKKYQFSCGCITCSKSLTFVSLILLIGAIASAAFLTIGILNVRNDNNLRFQQSAFEAISSIEKVWKDYEVFSLWMHESCHKSPINTNINVEEDVAGHLGFCSRKEFQKLYEYVNSVGLKFYAVEMIPYVPHYARDAVEAESRSYYQEHYPHINYTGFTSVKPGTHDLGYPQTEQPFYFPVHYMLPLGPNNEIAIDLDLWSHPAEQPAMETALATWQPTVTERIHLVEEVDDSAYSILLFHPGIPTSLDGDQNSNSSVITTEMNRTNLLSLVLIRMPDFLARAAQSLNKRSEIYVNKIYVYDSTNTTHDSESPSSKPPVFLGAVGETGLSLPETSIDDIVHHHNSWIHKQEIKVAKRKWTVVIFAETTDVFQPNLVYVVSIGCIIMVACVVLAVWFHYHLRRVQQVHQMRSRAESEKTQLAQAHVRVEQQLNEFMAHEVRNPLSSAISALSFVTSTAVEAQYATEETRATMMNDLEVMDCSLQFVNDLLRNMLDIHRADHKKIELKLRPTDLIKDIFEPVGAILFLRGAKVEICIECPENLMVNVDRMRLKQVVLNLAANSVKFVTKGFVRLRSIVVENAVQIHVEDSGPGIPPEKRDKLFARFQESLDELNQGTGIGLSICKSLSDLMGAKLGLDEGYDSGIKGSPGTRFVLFLNQAPIDLETTMDHDGSGEINIDIAEAEPKKVSVSDKMIEELNSEELGRELPEKLSVLFVDDDTILRKMFTRSLQRVCPTWEVYEASNGETAIQISELMTFDLIFIDQYMASVEKQLLGTETAKAMRSRGSQAIIVGLSANDREEEFLDAGANYFCLKPFPCEKDALKKELHRVLGTFEAVSNVKDIDQVV